jgi:hypothetical protein
VAELVGRLVEAALLGRFGLTGRLFLGLAAL